MIPRLVLLNDLQAMYPLIDRLSNLTDRKMRLIVSEQLSERVGTCGKGYFYITSRKEALEIAEGYDNRALALHARAKRLRDEWPEYDEQGELFEV